MSPNLRKSDKAINLIFDSAVNGLWLAILVLITLIVSLFTENLKSLVLQIPLLFVAIALFKTLFSAIKIFWFLKKEGKK